MLKINNKKAGSSFENEWASALQRRGGWVHKIAPSESGSQPFDLLHVRNGRAVGYECKTVNSYRFPLSRVEDNQYYAYKGFGHHIPVTFVFRHKDGDVYEIGAEYVMAAIDTGRASIDIREGEKYEAINR